MHALWRRLVVAVWGAVVLWSHPVRAQSAYASGAPVPPGAVPTQPPADRRAATAVDPTLDLLHAVSGRKLARSSVFARGVHVPTPGFDRHGAQASLRFVGQPTPERLAEIEHLGVRFTRTASGAVRHLGGVYEAWITWAALEPLRHQPDIVRVEAAWQPGIQAPLEVTGEIIGAAQARTHPDFGADGRGTTIALIDTGVDVLHPFFFRADGGLYAWIDVNGDGVFDPGLDAVDLDGNGRAGHNEVLRVLDATDVVDFADRQLDNDDGVLQAQRDWLYADMNGDHVRNVGVEAGFNESTPAYGEAVFVVDDANRDGKLEPGEKLVRLKTSKIAKYVTADATYVRGENLIDAATGGADAALHGSGSAGILVGGQPGYHTRVGIAPGADLMVYGVGERLLDQNSLPLDDLQQAVDDGATVVLHEWTNAFTMPLDGSTNFEAAMSAARDAGVVQVNPVGNLNIAQKHVQRTVHAGDDLALDFHVGDGFDVDGTHQAYSSVFGSLQWRGDNDLDVVLRPPSGPPIDLNSRIASSRGAGLQVDATRERTNRGTTIVRFYIEAPNNGASLPQGHWSFVLSGFQKDDTVYGRISDAYSNWHPGVGWDDPTGDQTTLAFPATADAAVGVAAYAGRMATPMEGGAQVGELRTFSGRGPRIDGAQAVDIAAPDDPFVPLGATPAILAADWGRSWFTRFGGTSGASPHVAASVALLRQMHPDWTPDQIEQRLFDTADHRALSPSPASIPDNGWGWGKLDVYRALFDEDPPAHNAAPMATLRAMASPEGLVWDASQSSDPDGDALQYRFDADYDGQWDTDWTDDPSFSVALPADGATRVMRLEVRDVHGARGGAVGTYPAGSGGSNSGLAGGAEDAGDAGSPADVGEANPSDSCCTTAPGARIPLPVHLLLGLGLLVGWRRRGARSK